MTYQAERLGYQRPGPQEAPDDKASENSFDLRDTTMLSVYSIFFDKQRSTICQPDLGEVLAKEPRGHLSGATHRK